MSERLEDLLGEDEVVVWVREPSRHYLKATLIIVQILGHVVLSGVAFLFVWSMPVGRVEKIIFGAVLLLSTNAPLVIWSVRRLPEIAGQGDALLFVTRERVGKLCPSGELRQAPVCPGLRLIHEGGQLRFNLGERTPVSFSGLTQEEAFLVTSVVEGMVQKMHDQNDAESAD